MAEVDLRIMVKAELKQAIAEMAKLEQAMESASRKSSQVKIGKAMDEVGTRITSLKKKYGELGAEAERGSLKQAAAAKNAAAAQAQLAAATTKQTVATKELGASVDKAGKSLEGFTNRGKFATRVLEAFVLYRGFVFLEQGIVRSTQALVQMNHQLALVQTQLPGMKGQPGMAGGVIDVARSTGMDINATATALYNITSAGYSGAEAMRVLGLTAKAAVAGGLAEADTAFNSALASMSAFNIGAEHIEEVFDKQFTAVRRGIFTYEQFSTQVGVLSEAFAQAGQSIETTYAAMATVSEVFTGPQFTRGATGLRNLAEALTQHREKFEEYGVSVVDVEGNMRNLIDVVGDLKALTEGMSSGESARVISDILPDVREQAGLVALIEKFDDLKRNYVEQKLALGDMDKAFSVVSQDIATQSGIMANNVKLGFGGLAGAVGKTVSGINEMERMLPGVTSAIVAMTAAVTGLAIAITYLQSANGKALRGFAMAPGTRIAAGAIGAGALGVGIGNKIEEAQGQRNAAGFFGAALAGAGAGGLVGSIGGLPGAGVGAAVGAVGAGAAYLMGDKAKEAGVTFADAFADSLAERSGDVGSALAAAYVDALKGPQGEQTALQMYQEHLARGQVVTPNEVPISESQPEGSPLRNYMKRVSRAYRSLLGDDYREPTVSRPKERPVGETFEEARQRALAAQAAVNSPQNQANAQMFATQHYIQTGERIDVQDLLRQQSEQAVADAGAEVFGAGSIGQSQFVDAFNAAGDNVQMFGDAIAALTSGPDGIVAFYDKLKKAPAPVDINKLQSDLLMSQSANYAAAAEVFGNMGAEGESLAKTFAELKRVGDALALAQQLFSLQTLQQTTTVTPGMDFSHASAQAMDEGITPWGNQAEFQRRTAQLMAPTVTTSSALADMFSPEFQKEANEMILAQMTGMSVEEIRNLDPAAFVAALFGTVDATNPTAAKVAPPAMGATSLADALNEAAEAVRQGLVDPMGYTSDQLMGMADSLYAFNKIMAKVNILEELKRIADLTGTPFTALPSAMAVFSADMAAAGVSLVDIFSDPAKLAEFLAGLEVGDINVDQSQNNNIVIRVSGGSDLDVGRAAEFADALRKELLNVNRRSSA